MTETSDTSDTADEQPDGPRSKGAAGLLLFALHSAWRRRILIIVTGAIGMLVGVYRVLKIPDEYGSVGKLFVRPSIRETLTPESAFAAGEGMARMSIRESILNEMQILSSPELFERAVEIVGAETLLTPFEPSVSGSESWIQTWVQQIKRWTNSSAVGVESPVDDAAKEQMALAASIVMSRVALILPEMGSRVISFRYTADSPGKAQAAVNALLAAAVDVHSEVFNSMSSVGTIEAELKSAEEIAVTAETALRTFRAEKNIYDFDLQRETLLAYLGQVDQLLDTGATELARKQAEVGLLVEQEKTIKKVRDVQGSVSFVLNPRYGALTTLLTQAQLRDLELDALKSTLPTDDYGRRKKALAEFVDKVQQQLRDEDVQLKLQGSQEDNPDYVEIVQALQRRRVELKGLGEQGTRLQQVIQETQKRLGDLEAIYPDLQRLELDARQKRETADRLASAVSNLRAVQRLEQLNLSNLQIMHPATYEPSRIGPKRTQRVLLAGAVGAMLGFALAFLLSWRDKLVRTRQDLAWISSGGEQMLIEGAAKASGDSQWDPDKIPPAVASMREEIVQAWSALPYDRRAEEALRLAFIPCGGSADAGRSAGMLAIGLAALGGESVAYVPCTDDDGWLAHSLQVRAIAGWSEVLAGELPLEQALLKTEIRGLSYLPVGLASDEELHPMASPGFVALLDKLCSTHRFVIVELPDIEARPESRAVLKVMDGAQLVVCAGKSKRADVRNAMAVLDGAGTRLIATVLQVGRA